MDALTRLYWEIEGYRDLGMWEEFQGLLESLFSDVPEQPQLLGILVTLGVAVEFAGRGSQLRPAHAAQRAA
ncbi:MAG: hypothetical protein PW734_02290 [Verrucomicrobium sp.]|nr:hypothetical protein [Verrucomicrobium sp.]